MTYSEATKLLETWKEETFRVHGVTAGIALLAGSLISATAYLLDDSLSAETIREVVKKQITDRIENLKTLPNENLQ